MHSQITVFLSILTMFFYLIIMKNKETAGADYGENEE